MKVVIEFYRTRQKDDAHAVIGREVVDAVDLASALDQAREMSRTLDMPQRPDVVTLADEAGATLYSEPFETDHLKEANNE